MTALPTTSTVAVIGAGTMGAGIAQVAATAGHPVRLFDVESAAVEKGLAGIRKILARSVERGRLDEAEKEAILGRIEPAGALNDLADAKLIVEAIVERVDVKQSVFKELEEIVTDEAILASNTSSLSITEIGAALSRPGQLVGMHFFNPAPLMKLVEVVLGLATDDATKETVFDTAAAWGKKPVYAKSTPGFIANRIARPYYSESLRLLQEQAADVASIDAVLREAGGFRMGPFELMDLIGTDVNLMVTKSVWEAFHFDPRYAPNLLQQELVSAGRLGRKAGIGWYDHRDGAEKLEPSTTPHGPKPKRVILSQNPDLIQEGMPYDPAADLVKLARDAGIEVAFEEFAFDVDDYEEIDQLLTEETTFEPSTAEDMYSSMSETIIRLDGADLCFAGGAPAYRHEFIGDENPAVYFDLALDYAATPRIAIAAAHGAPRTALLAAAGFFQALGKEVSVVADVPGLVLLRTTAMLANEAADAVYQGVCDEAGADSAMLNGLNYPKGPLAWARELGAHRICDVLEGLHDYYRDPRYRLSPYLDRLRHEQQEHDI